MKYYDPEYRRIVDEDVIRKQYEWFQKQPWFTKSYEEFREECFIALNTDNLEDAVDYVIKHGGTIGWDI